MRKYVYPLLAILVVAAPAHAAKRSKVIEPLKPELIGALVVGETRVTINDAAKANVEKLDAKAAQKREAAKLAPVDNSTLNTRPAETEYETLPLVRMLPLKVEDVAHQRGLAGTHRVNLVISIDTLKTADAAAGILLGSADELAGMVDVIDAADGSRLGEFYVDVLNYQGGWLAMAIRGSGVREKMATTFANQIADQLNGGKMKAAS